jgi:hypothetical protein
MQRVRWIKSAFKILIWRNTAHDGFNIRKYASGGNFISLSKTEVFKWSPDSGTGVPGDLRHARFSGRAGLNSVS